ncbi:SDR family oxidoreductase [Novosphingobium sp. ERW19]|uniref:SDR family oxidoreductase n=1 Tax=Novosphingobium sp. ERW19 TaxID=2726186 RepID=UPI001456F5A8|nr:SDR family oxidoreductase [Novosphingobium sp. ERW19]
MARKGIVVGGAGGIGQAIVEAAIQAGDEVIVLDRGPGSCGHFVACDQSDPASVEKAFAAIDEAFAGASPDWMVATASISRRHGVLDADPATILELLKVNVLGTALVAQAAGRRMRDARGGTIVVITSIAAAQAWQNESFYCVTKAAQAALVQALAVELGPYGVRVNAVGPGPVDVTSRDMVSTRNDGQIMSDIIRRTPGRRLAAPHEIADVALFLTRTTWVNGQTLYVDGGYLASGMLE